MEAGRQKDRQTKTDRQKETGGQSLVFIEFYLNSCMLFTPLCFTCNGIIVMTSVATEVLYKYLCSEMTSGAERYIINNQVPVQCNLTACLNFGSS